MATLESLEATCGKASERPLAVDLFSGAGGMSLGFEQAGFDVAVAVEYDPIHAAIHELNFPYTAVICGDVSSLTGAQIRDASGIADRGIDAVFGGPPCQGFSLIGHRVLDDPRNSLVFHFHRLVAELRPRVFVMENVPGMVTGGHATLLRELVELFREDGYRVNEACEILNAGWYGVPQDRRRVVLLGARGDTPTPQYPSRQTNIRSARPRPRKDSLASLPDGPSVRDAIADIPDIEVVEGLLDDDVLDVVLRDGSSYALRLRGDAGDPTDFSYRRIRRCQGMTGCRRARHTPLSRSRFAATAPGSTEPVSRFFRLAWDGVSNTLRAGTGSERGAYSAPRPIHPEAPRCISVREAARLHSYPDWFRFHATIWHGFRQIGNSVPPLLARAVGNSVMTALGQNPTVPAKVLTMGSEDLARLNMTKASAHFGMGVRAIPSRRRGAAKQVG